LEELDSNENLDELFFGYFVQKLNKDKENNLIIIGGNE
jgi:hypothetical protein